MSHTETLQQPPAPELAAMQSEPLPAGLNLQAIYRRRMSSPTLVREANPDEVADLPYVTRPSDQPSVTIEEYKFRAVEQAAMRADYSTWWKVLEDNISGYAGGQRFDLIAKLRLEASDKGELTDRGYDLMLVGEEVPEDSMIQAAIETIRAVINLVAAG